MFKGKKIYVAGHNGMVGSSIIRKLKANGIKDIVTRSSADLDLRIQKDVDDFFHTESIDLVFVAAAKVGGIKANAEAKGTFLYDNLMIESNIIHAAKTNGVEKLLFLGSSCIYPKESSYPIKEDQLLKGSLGPTNDAYAIAKIAGIFLCNGYREEYGCNFISAMPTNLYGPNDNYNLETSHVLPALIRKFHEAKISAAPSVEVWGSGKPLREFLFIDDLAEACIFLMENYNEPGHINVGSGEEISIADLANLIKLQIGYDGDIIFNKDFPDGTYRKVLDSSRIQSMGWQSQIGLKEGINLTYQDFEKNCIKH